MLIPDHPPHPGSAPGQAAAQGKARDGNRQSLQSGVAILQREARNLTEYLIHSRIALSAKL